MLPLELTGYQVDDDLFEQWSTFFTRLLLITLLLNSIDSLQHTVDSLHQDINAASTTVFSPKKYPDSHGVRWWNSNCSLALTAVYFSSGNPRQAAICTLRRTIAQLK